MRGQKRRQRASKQFRERTVAQTRMTAMKVTSSGQIQGVMLNVRLVELADGLDICSRKRKDSNVSARLWD